MNSELPISAQQWPAAPARVPSATPAAGRRPLPVRLFWSNTLWHTVAVLMLLVSLGLAGLTMFVYPQHDGTAGSATSAAKKKSGLAAAVPAAAPVLPQAPAAAQAAQPAALSTAEALQQARILAAAFSGNADPSAAARPRQQPSPVDLYSVRPGESLSSIAVGFGVPEPLLAAVNGLAPTAWLQVGQKLRIPAAGPVLAR